MGNVIATLIVLLLIAVVVGWIIIRLLSRSYVKTTATTAFVRTGGLRRSQSGEPLVVMNGAAWVFGFLHRIKWVSLETMTIEVRHVEQDAAVTNDPQYVDVEARFFVKVEAKVEYISRAARTIGGDLVDEANVRRLVQAKIRGAVRDVAASFSLNELLEKRIAFIQQTQGRLKDDLAENGLILESISILTLRPTLQGHFSTDDILGAQVARVNAAVIEAALTEKNRVENESALARTRQNAETESARMAIEESLENERAERARSIASVRAVEEAEAKVIQEEKRQESERARILTERALQEETIENERQAELLREQTRRIVEIEQVLRVQEVGLAEQEREKRLAEAVTVTMAATRAQIDADKEREKALQQAITLADTATAEREAEIELIQTRSETEKRALISKNEIELEAQRMQRLAKAEREAADALAEAARIRAESALDTAKKEALGDRERLSAAGLADVQVALERAKAAEKEAEGIRFRLLAEADGEKAKAEAFASHGGVGQQIELARINADVLRAIEIAKAEALGGAISSMKMNVFGDAAMANRLLQMIAAAQSTQHIYEALPPAAQGILGNLAARLDSTRNGSNSEIHNGIPEALDHLMAAVNTHFPEAMEENPTLGELSQRIIEATGEKSDSVGVALQGLIDNPNLKNVPLQTALNLAQDWLGWSGSSE